MTRVPVLDIGGSHVAGAWVDIGSWTVDAASIVSRPLAPDGAADDLIVAMATTAADLGDLEGLRLTAAVPGPFDYAAGVARYTGVGKFEALTGLDLGAELLAALPTRPADLVFLNDATAFALGEWVAGAAAGASRVIGITLGTGVGSGFLADGVPVESGPSVPPDAEMHLTFVDGTPLEDLVSTRAIVREFGRAADGVLDVVLAARTGDPHARSVLDTAFATLGRALAPWVLAFAADTVVVGGKIADAWDVIAPPIRRGLREHGVGAGYEHEPVTLVPAARPATAAETGAAWYGRNHDGTAYDDPSHGGKETSVSDATDDETSTEDGLKGAARKVREAASDARTAAADKLRDGFDKVIDSLDGLSSKKEQ